MLPILFKNSSQPYGSRLSYETYGLIFLYDSVASKKNLNVKIMVAIIYFLKKRFKKIKNPKILKFNMFIRKYIKNQKNMSGEKYCILS